MSAPGSAARQNTRDRRTIDQMGFHRISALRTPHHYRSLTA